MSASIVHAGGIEKSGPPRVEWYFRRIVGVILRLPAPAHKVVDRAAVAYEFRFGESRAPDAQPEGELPGILPDRQGDGRIVRCGGDTTRGRVVRSRTGHGDEETVELHNSPISGDVGESGVDAGL